MRYPKGSLQLNPSRDLPLLRQILHSEYVAHSQLFDLMRLNHYEHSRKSFDWRVRRLVDRALVRRQTTPNCTGEFVYSVASSAAVLLQGEGEYCLLGRHRFNGNEAERSVPHAIGLNEIQLTALRAGLLVRWIGSLEIRSQNELTAFGFAKDYDAVVTIRTDIGERRFALEYERTPKPAKRYRAIAASMNEEVHVNRLLYVVANYDILRFVSGFFANTDFPVFFGLLADWHSHLLDMPVLDAVTKRAFPFRRALNGSTLEVETIAAATNYPLPFH